MEFDLKKNIYVRHCLNCDETEMMNYIPDKSIGCIGCNACMGLSEYIPYDKVELETNKCVCSICKSLIVPKDTPCGKKIRQCKCFGMYYDDKFDDSILRRL